MPEDYVKDTHIAVPKHTVSYSFSFITRKPGSESKFDAATLLRSRSLQDIHHMIATAVIGAGNGVCEESGDPDLEAACALVLFSVHELVRTRCVSGDIKRGDRK